MKYQRYSYIVLLLLFISKGYAFDFITDRGNGMGQTVLLSKSSASTLLIVPSGGIADGAGKVELGINRKFEIKDLDQGYLAAVYRKKLFTYAIGFTQFGYTDLYAEKTARAGLTFHYDSFSLGATLATMLVEFGDKYERLSSSAIGLGASYRGKKLYGALVIDNINSPELNINSKKIKPNYSAYSEIIGKGSYSITGRLTLEADQKPQFGVGQIINLSPNGSFFWGLSTQPTIYGGGIELSYKNNIISYATSYHQTLGFSHTIALNYSFGDSPK